MTLQSVLIAILAAAGALGLAISLLTSSPSSMWGLIFLRLPFVQWLLLAMFGGIGIVVLAFSLWWAGSHYRLTTSSGRMAQGRVVDQRRVYSTITHNKHGSSGFGDPNEDTTHWVNFFPIVQFETDKGQTLRFEGRVDGTSKPWLQTGATVRVFYDPEKPSEAFIGNFSEAWLGPLVVSLLGLCLLLCGLSGLVVRRRVLVSAWASARSPEALAAQVERDRLASEQYPVHIQGRVERTQRLDASGPPGYVFICKGLRPGAGEEEEFQTDSFPFDPGSGFVGRAVDIYLDLNEPGNHYVASAPLLRELGSRR